MGKYYKLMDEYANTLGNQEEYTTPWHCLKCRIIDNQEKFPFTLCNDVLLMNIRDSDSMKMFEALPSIEAVSKVSKFPNLRNNKVDENLTINCKYYLVDNFQKLQAKNKKNFNIFHSTVNGLESHHDVFHTFLSGIPTDFNLLNITETS